MSDFANHLRRSAAESQEKYTHFLLATTAAAIAFAVQRTSDASASFWQIPLAAAVLSWGYSFYCGCQRLTTVQSIHFETLDALRADQMNREVPIPDYAQSRSASKARVSALGVVARRYWYKQFFSLIAGGFLFILWHVIEMFVRANSTPGPRIAAGVGWV